MDQLRPIYERVPLVWVLVGLLLISTGLWLGFEFTMSFVYMVIGLFCCAFGVALFALRAQELTKTSARTRLSPHFVSAGSEVMPPKSAPEKPPANENLAEQASANDDDAEDEASSAA